MDKLVNYVRERRDTIKYNVVVAVSRWNHKYIKTEADGKQLDNLLSLLERQ